MAEHQGRLRGRFFGDSRFDAAELPIDPEERVSGPISSLFEYLPPPVWSVPRTLNALERNRARSYAVAFQAAIGMNCLLKSFE